MYLCICYSQYMCLGNKENRPLVIFLVTFTDNTPVLDSDCSNPLFSDFCSPCVAHFTLFLPSLTPPSFSNCTLGKLDYGLVGSSPRRWSSMSKKLFKLQSTTCDSWSNQDNQFVFKDSNIIGVGSNEAMIFNCQRTSFCWESRLYKGHIFYARH